MMKNISGAVLFVIGFSIFASGCGDGQSSGSSLAPLTDAQKAAVKSTSSNLMAISETAINAQAAELKATASPNPLPSSVNPSPNPSASAALVTVTVTQPSPTPSRSNLGSQMLSALTSVTTWSFAPVVTGGKNGQPLASLDQKISGSGCPIAMDYTSTFTPASNGQTATKLDMEYNVLDNSFRKLNDIDSASLQMTNTTSASQNSVVTLTAKLHSQANGAIKYNYSMNDNGQTIAAEILYQFPTFTADIRVSGLPSGKFVTGSINGQSISQDEAESYIALPTMAVTTK
jgi:hypothetical protein